MPKKLILPVFLFFVALSLRAQETAKEPAKPLPEAEKVYEMFDVQTQPSFPGGEVELMKFLSGNIMYPAEALENNIQGIVVLQFVIGKDGSVSDITHIRKVVGGCTEEATRVVGIMPNWTPGQVDGKPAQVRFTLPIRFRLE